MHFFALTLGLLYLLLLGETDSGSAGKQPDEG
jgi:hypothetical protein